MSVQNIAAKYRRAMRNGTSATFTAAELVLLRDLGAMVAFGIYPSDHVAAPLPIVGVWPVGAVVYFVGPQDGPVKIGYASDLRARFNDLKYMSPSPIHVWAFVHGAMALEKQYHARFKSCRLHGEWFDRTAELVEEIRFLNMAEAL